MLLFCVRGVFVERKFIVGRLGTFAPHIINMHRVYKITEIYTLLSKQRTLFPRGRVNVQCAVKCVCVCVCVCIVLNFH